MVKIYYIKPEVYSNLLVHAAHKYIRVNPLSIHELINCPGAAIIKINPIDNSVEYVVEINNTKSTISYKKIMKDFGFI